MEHLEHAKAPTGLARARLFSSYLEKWIDFALELNLDACIAPVETLRSMASPGFREVFFKRDNVRLNPMPNAEAALAAIPLCMEDYSDIHRHSRIGYRSPREYIRVTSKPAACPD